MISKNSAWSIAGSAVPAAIAILAIPTLFYALGSQLFSICSLLISLAIFFFVYDFGIARSITYFIAKSDLDRDYVNAAFGQGALWACFFSCIAALLVFCTAPWFVTHWLTIDLVLHEPIVQSFRIAAYGIPASVLCHVFRGILEGHSDFKAANLGKMVSGASIFLAPLVMVKLNILHIQDLSLAITCTRYASLGLYIFLIWGKVDFKKTSIRIQTQESLISYAAWAAISGFISTLFIYGDRFFVAGYVEAETLAIYIGSQDILIRYLLIPWSMATVLLPVFAAGKLTKNEESKFYFAHQKKILWLSITFVALVLAGIVLIDWLALIHLNQQAKLIISLQAIGVFFAALSQMPLILLLAKGKPRLLTYIYVFEFLIYLMIAPTILSFANGTGAGLLWAGRLILEYCLLSYAMNKTRKA
jgi:O-antigen/teichoic acid export membrane protein